MTTIPEVLQEARTHMDRSIESVRRELGGVRSGKATTQLLDLVRVEAYGQSMPLTQVALVNAPEARLLTVQPFDKGLAQAVEKAIRDADLGLNPAGQGALIRVPIPPLSEERRKELVRLTHKLAEEGRVAIRHARHEALNKIKKLEKTSEDEKARADKEVQKLTDEHTAAIDKLLASKEAELMEV